MLLLNELFMKVKVKNKQEIAQDTIYIEFDLSGQSFPFKPGQFFQLTLINPPYSDERGNSRYFGFVNSPDDKDYVSMVTRTGTSAYKKSLAMLNVGDECEIGGLGGHDVLGESLCPVVMIAGGIGIAPFMSVVRYSIKNGVQFPITLIYSNLNKITAAFFDELTDKSLENNTFKFVPIITNDPAWVGEKGEISKEFILKTIQNPQDNKYFICGTKEFVLPVVQSIKEAGVALDKIAFEIFTGY